MEEANEDGDQSDIRHDKEDKEEVREDEEDEDSVDDCVAMNNECWAPSVIDEQCITADKRCITAEELEGEMKKVLCHAYDICLLWVSYTRAGGELMKLGESLNPKNKAALQIDLNALTNKYSKRQKTSHFPASMTQSSWISVLKDLMMVQVQHAEVPSNPDGELGKHVNLVVERARDIYKHCEGSTGNFMEVCSKVRSKLAEWDSLPPGDMVGYNKWFRLQPEYKDWNSWFTSQPEYKASSESEEDLEKEEGEEEEQDQPKYKDWCEEDLEKEEEEGQKPATK